MVGQRPHISEELDLEMALHLPEVSMNDPSNVGRLAGELSAFHAVSAVASWMIHYTS